MEAVIGRTAAMSKGTHRQSQVLPLERHPHKLAADALHRGRHAVAAASAWVGAGAGERGWEIELSGQGRQPLSCLPDPRPHTHTLTL